VQIIYVNSILERMQGREKDGVRRLLLRLTQKRQHLQKQVSKAISRLQDDGTLSEMENTLRTMRGTFLLRKTADYSAATYRSARDEISSRLSEMLGYGVYIHDPERITELHAMRIAAKHLRYCMESFDPLYDGKLKRYIKAVKTLQEQLGDIHDCDVWMEFLPAFLVEEKDRIVEFTGQTRSVGRLKPGISLLEADRRTFRQKRYKEFLMFWEANTGLWPHLLKTLESFYSPGEGIQNGQGNHTP
jgi:CHAD domain-containing protein